MNRKGFTLVPFCYFLLLLAEGGKHPSYYNSSMTPLFLNQSLKTLYINIIEWFKDISDQIIDILIVYDAILTP